MCGIAGWLGHVPDGRRVATRITRRLHHRGPDAQVFRQWPEATLIHTRLSIIDLSSAGAQPMSNEDGSIWVVFNGEIYNHRELRRELEQRHHTFRGRSDTEVLPHLYEEEGADCISRLRGMFALAIYDTRRQVLLLARDRFGIKPLFYASSGNRLSFASEIGALREVPGIDERPDPQAISDFAALMYIPAPETFYVGIRALMPDHLLEARLEGSHVSWTTRAYHQFSLAPNPRMTLTEAADRAAGLVEKAVQRQMESDVPLGSLLSGGVDSSLVSALAQSTASQPLRTFNVRFPEEAYDETWAAVAVARHIGSRHETLDLGSRTGTWPHVTNLLAHAGQPFADTSLFAVHALCRRIRQFVTVALSGDGGDEAFGGYDWHWHMSRVAQLQRLPVSVWGLAAALAKPAARLGLVRRSYPERIRDLSGADDTALIEALFCTVREGERQQLTSGLDVLPVRRLFERQWVHHLPADASRIDRLAAHATEANMRLALPNDFLFKVDLASMRESLEVRVPLLDEDVVAFGLELPRHLMVKGKTCKLVLREIANTRLPAEVAGKVKKGFEIPVDDWVDAQFKAALRDALLDSPSPLSDVFQPSVYKTWVKSFCEGTFCEGISRSGLYLRVTMLLSLHLALSSSKN
jgi:asparagine synthase (glutamine-hydrolysing)